jgi:hypothetical protein
MAEYRVVQGFGMDWMLGLTYISPPEWCGYHCSTCTWLINPVYSSISVSCKWGRCCYGFDLDGHLIGSRQYWPVYCDVTVYHLYHTMEGNDTRWLPSKHWVMSHRVCDRHRQPPVRLTWGQIRHIQLTVFCYVYIYTVSMLVLIVKKTSILTAINISCFWQAKKYTNHAAEKLKQQNYFNIQTMMIQRMFLFRTFILYIYKRYTNSVVVFYWWKACMCASVHLLFRAFII